MTAQCDGRRVSDRLRAQLRREWVDVDETDLLIAVDTAYGALEMFGLREDPDAADLVRILARRDLTLRLRPEADSARLDRVRRGKTGPRRRRIGGGVTDGA